MTLETKSTDSNLPLINLIKDSDTSSFHGSAKSNRALSERIVYRSKKLPELSEARNERESVVDHAECPRCHSVIPIRAASKSKDNSLKVNLDLKTSAKNQSRNSARDDDRNSCCRCECSRRVSRHSPKKEVGHFHKGKLYKNNDNVDWSDLNSKIENWFEDAKTPDQRAVYHFLKDLGDDDDAMSVLSERGENKAEKVKSLEDILDNLKKYRTKFEQKSYLKSAIFPQLNNKSNKQSLGNLFESSTWRVMRHIRSADIRNKYPLPKANPDEYFRNSTVFHVAGRVPKSTFLLHPEWV